MRTAITAVPAGWPFMCYIGQKACRRHNLHGKEKLIPTSPVPNADEYACFFSFFKSSQSIRDFCFLNKGDHLHYEGCPCLPVYGPYILSERELSMLLAALRTYVVITCDWIGPIGNSSPVFCRSWRQGLQFCRSIRRHETAAAYSFPPAMSRCVYTTNFDLGR